MSDETDSDISEDVEPIFKYVRIGNYLKSILNNDIVTCVAVHEKFLAFGTFFGRIHLLDHQGHLVESLENKLKKVFHFHKVAVNQISIDKKGEYIASCSDDGNIFLTGLFGNDSDQKLTLDKSVKCIVMDSEAKYSSGKRFIIGYENLTLYEKNFLNNMKPVVLSKADGVVSSISWNNQFVAWASNSDVRVYDLNEKCSLGVMKWEEPKNYSLKNFRCNLKWSNAVTLLIGWVDTVRVCIIRKRNSIDASTRLYPSYIVDPISTFQTPFFISGLAPLDINQLVLLGYPKERNEDNKALRPILCVITYSSNDYERLTTDRLSLRGYQEYKVNDYFLEYIEEEKRYFIVAPKDIVVANLHNIDDKVQWLIDHNKFDQALEVISSNNVKFSYLSVAILYIDYLLSLKQYDSAAKLCSTTLGNNKSLWEKEVYNFVKHQELRSISPYLPSSNENKLDPHVYEMVLFENLKIDPKAFLSLIKLWSPELYNSKAVINAIQDNFNKENGNELLEALAILYTHQENYNCALKLYLTIKNKQVFKLIETHKLYSSVYPMIIPLLELDIDMALSNSVLLNEEISSDMVVEQLEQRQDLLFEYLQKLDKPNDKRKFHWKLVNLYAKFDHKGLLPFLKRSNNYPIQEALEICRAGSFYEEMVYLLERMGNTSEALNIIVHKLKNIEEAIDFCKRLGDYDLWNDLIRQSLEKPEIIPELLNNIVGYINPEILVEKIKPEQNITDLKNSLIKMLRDYSLQLCIQEGYNNVVVTDYFNLHEKLINNNRRGIYINYDAVTCSYCNREIMQKEINKNDIIVFNCHHIFHEICLPDVNTCIICNK